MVENIEYSTTGKPHPFHIVRPSPWPLMGALAAGLLAIGALLYMHEIKFGDFPVGLKGVVIGLLAVGAAGYAATQAAARSNTHVTRINQ